MVTGLPQITVTNAGIVDTALLAHGFVAHGDQHCAGGVGPIRRENAHQLPLGAPSGGSVAS